MMDRRLKERLVGATLLVALIVLVVPELLSGPKRRTVRPSAEAVPATTRNYQVDLSTSQAVPEPTGASTPGASTPGASAPGASARQASDAGAMSASSPGTAPPASAAASRSDAEEQAAPANEARPGAPDAGAPSRGVVTTLKAQEGSAPVLETPASPPTYPPGSRRAAAPTHASARHGWAVQLGSFASKTNAERLAHQLQAAGGSSVYVVAGGSGAALRYRVRMGPLADRSAAERAAGRLKAQGHAATIVTPPS